MKAKINALFSCIRVYESMLSNVRAAETVSCKYPPLPSGESKPTLLSFHGNAVDCLVKTMADPDSGKVCIVNPAHHKHRGGGVGVSRFMYPNIPLEETLVVVGAGLKASLDKADGYPLGSATAQCNQLYSRGIQLRYSPDQLDQLAKAPGQGSGRIAAQRDLLLSFQVSSDPRAREYDVVSIAAPDRRDNNTLTAEKVEGEMSLQFARALAKATSEKVDTFILPLPGSGLYARFFRHGSTEQDPAYLGAVARAAAWALKNHGGHLKVIIPSHGPQLDELLRSAMAAHGLRFANAPVCSAAAVQPHIKPPAGRGSPTLDLVANVPNKRVVHFNPPAPAANVRAARSHTRPNAAPLTSPAPATGPNRADASGPAQVSELHLATVSTPVIGEPKQVRQPESDSVHCRFGNLRYRAAAQRLLRQDVPEHVENTLRRQLGLPERSADSTQDGPHLRGNFHRVYGPYDTTGAPIPRWTPMKEYPSGVLSALMGVETRHGMEYYQVRYQVIE